MARKDNSQRRLKGYYGFQKKYPSRRGERPIHETRKAKIRERIKTVLFCVFLCCLFAGVFIFVKLCYNLSTRPLDTNSEQSQTITVENIGTVRAIYIENDILDDIGQLNNTLNQAKENKFNAIMLDFKTEEGILTYDSKLLSYSGQEKYNKIDRSLIERIKLEGFLVVGRIHCFEDTIAPQRLSAYVYEDIEKTQIWFDSPAILDGKVWLDPTNARTTKYLTSVVSEVATLGADCIYLDSVQFPESREGSIPVYTEDDTTLNRNLVLMQFVENAVKSANGRPVILGVPLEGVDDGNSEKWGGTLFDTSAHISSPLLEDPGNGNYIEYIENSYIVYNDKAKNNFSTTKVIPTIKNSVKNNDFYVNLASSRTESYIIIP